MPTFEEIKKGLDQDLINFSEELKNKFPGAVVTSGYRPGSKTVKGQTSRHSHGEALDFRIDQKLASYLNSPEGVSLLNKYQVGFLDESIGKNKKWGNALHIGKDSALVKATNERYNKLFPKKEEGITNNINYFDSKIELPNFALNEPKVEEKGEEEVDEDVKQVEAATNFLEEYEHPLVTAEVEEEEAAPEYREKIDISKLGEINFLEEYAKIDNLLSEPVAQQGTVNIQEEWLNNWVKNREIEGKPLNIKSRVPISKSLNIEDLNTDKTQVGYTYGQYDPYDDKVTYDPNFEKGQSIPVHESTHRLQNYILGENVGTYKENLFNPIMKLRGDNRDPYLDDPQEIHSRIMSLRKDRNFSPKQVIKEEDLKGANLRSYDLDRYDRGALIDTMNKTVSLSSTLKNYAQQGYKTGNKVKYGTPEYKEAYRRGEVVTDEGVHSPIELNEVAVKNNYKRNWLEEYRDKIIEDNREVGPLQAAVGVPISAVASLPQMLGMKLLTDKFQTPSEKWGFQQNEDDSKTAKFVKGAGNFVFDAVTDPLNLVGAGVLTKEKALAKIAASKEAGLLSNAYKLNPKAFKPTIDKFYRQIDNATYNEGLESGLIRGKQDIGHSGTGGVNLNKSFGDDAYYNKGSLYYKDRKNLQYLFEANLPEERFIPKVNGRTRKYTTENTSVRVSKEPIPINDPNIAVYKKDWLQGYKQVEVPKTNNFKSEIDWGNWNKEIPDNPQLMQEYNAIEQSSKANGSWMKNPDGSKFQGTPEQFVQQNSDNFKKAFSGKVNKQYHTTDKNFEVFDTTKSPSKGIFFTPNKEYSEKFTKIYKPSEEVSNTGEYYLNVNKPLNVDDPISHTTVSHYYNQRPFAAGNYDAIQGKEMDILGGKSDIDVTTVFNPKQVKSAVGNNGVFDMNNPNIYKSLIPIAGVATTLSQNKQQGGPQLLDNEAAFLKDLQGNIIKDNMGQWKHPGKITEIASPSITMRGVNYPVLGVSKETGEQKLMMPNLEYFFHNTNNVVEYPLKNKK